MKTFHLSALLVSLYLLSSPVFSGVIYVNHSSIGPFDGQTWGTAFQSLDEALTAANQGDDVWVAQGTYAVRNINLKSDMRLLGGFEGIESSASGRDPIAHVSILEGYGPTPNGTHLLILDGLTTVTIDGFTIRKGYAKYVAEEGQGGAIKMKNGGDGIVISNNVFFQNHATIAGGAIFCSNSAPLISNNIFSENSCGTATGAIGGTDIACLDSSHAIIENNVFVNSGAGNGSVRAASSNPVIRYNQFDEGSRGVSSSGSAARIHNNVFRKMFQTSHAINCGTTTDEIRDNYFLENPFVVINVFHGSPTIVGNVFSGNYGETNFYQGGCIYIESGSSLIQYNIFADNLSYHISVCIEMQGSNLKATVANNLFTHNSSPEDPIIGLGGDLVVVNNVFVGNKASAPFSVGTTVTNCPMANNKIVGNDSVYIGGGVVHGKFLFHNNLVAMNRGTENGGTSLRTDFTRVVSNIFFDNSGIQLQEGDEFADPPELTHNLFWNVNDGIYRQRHDYVNNTIYTTIADWENAMPEAESNYFANPLFTGDPQSTGQWSANPVYDPTTIKTEFTNSLASWTTNSLSGMFLQVDSNNSKLLASIAGNTPNSIQVWGNYSGESASGLEYQIWDFNLMPPHNDDGSGSPAIDAGPASLEFDDAAQPPGLGTIRNDLGPTGGPFNADQIEVINLVEYLLIDLIVGRIPVSPDSRAVLDLNGDGRWDIQDVLIAILRRQQQLLP